MDFVGTILDEFDTAARAHRERVARSPLAGAIAAGSLPAAIVDEVRRGLDQVAAALAEAAATADGEAASLVVEMTSERSRPDSPVTADAGPSPKARLHALVLAEEVRARGAVDPAALVGFAFAVAEALPVGLLGDEPTAIDRDRLATLLAGPTIDREDALEAVLEAFAEIGPLVAALWPVDSRRLPELVGVLNQRAGTHGVPDDLREIRAALRAGEATWRRFPYYARRWGPRGRRFTRSDSAWLVTLCRLGPAELRHQVDWLGRVLTARGMPRWLLEIHLHQLHQALVEEIGPSDLYHRLADAAETLHRGRRHHLNDDAFARLYAEFDVRVGDDWCERMRGTGGILASAVADEAAGIPRAVESLEGWMTDPDRFPSHWIEAVRATLDDARRAAVRPAP